MYSGNYESKNRKKERGSSSEVMYLTSKITSTRNICGWNPFTIYILSVRWKKRGKEIKWKISKRFRDFDKLVKQLSQRITQLPKLPVKTWMRKMDSKFIRKRKRALNRFMEELLIFPKVLRSRIFWKFLKVDENIHPKQVEEPQESADSGAVMNHQLTVNDFEFLKVIGKGTFGKVIQVRKKDTNEIYAMKILKKQTLIAKKQIRNTKTERRVLASINHPFIVSLRYAFQTKDKLYMVLDYFNGGELFFHLNKGKFSEHRSRQYTAQLILALECLHSQKIIYRDLKPENVLLDEEGFVRLTDFGLSKESFQGDIITRTFCGTPHYIAPEIIQRKDYGKEVDWWSLGTLLYEMLTGLPPFYNKNVKKMYENICFARLNFPPYVHDDARHIIRGLLERDPNRRFGSGPYGIDDLKKHPFFETIDWEKLYNKEITPCFKPNVTRGALDTTNISKDFKRLKPIDSPVERSGFLSSKDKYHFPDFTYTNSDFDDSEDALEDVEEKYIERTNAVCHLETTRLNTNDIIPSPKTMLNSRSISPPPELILSVV